MLALLDEIDQASGFGINYKKSEIPSQGKKTFFTTKMRKIASIKLLGVPTIHTKNMEPGIKSQLLEKCETAPKLVAPAKSLRARVLKFQTFITSKLIYQLRHHNNCKGFTNRVNSCLINYLWMNKKHCVNQEIVTTPPKNCGTGLKHLYKIVVTAKYTNLKFLALRQPKQAFLDFLKKSKAYKFLEELKKENIEIIHLEHNNLKLQYFFQSFDVNKKTESKQIYNFLMKSIIKIPCFAKVYMTAMNQKVSPNTKTSFLRTLRKNKKLMTKINFTFS